MHQYILLASLFINFATCQSEFGSNFNQLLSYNKLSVDSNSAMDFDINGAGLCSMLAGCKILNGRKGCYGPSGTRLCSKCFFTKTEVPKRNVMRADFYRFFDKATYKSTLQKFKECTGTVHPTDETFKCTDLPFLHELATYMILEGDEIARSYQGAVFQDHRIGRKQSWSGDYKFNVPLVEFPLFYSKQFCTQECYIVLRSACIMTTLLPHVRQWCLTVLGWLKDDIDTLRGPPSWILFLAARLVNPTVLEPPSGNGNWVDPEVKCYSKLEWPREKHEIPCKWPNSNPSAEFEEKATLVSAAASSVLLAGTWFQRSMSHIQEQNSEFEDLGFAIQHSLWLAIYAGRLRVTLHGPIPDNLKNGRFPPIIPGTQTLCSSEDKDIADNFEGVTGSVYASLCATFPKLQRQHGVSEETQFKIPYGPINLRFRTEIHTRHSLGCVERTNGMIFIKPGDWITPDANRSRLGTPSTPNGILFTDQITKLTTVELARGRVVMYPPSIAVAFANKSVSSSMCQDAVGNGPSLNGELMKCGLNDIGGICNWIPVW